jgi:hypothetical protein
MDGWSRSIGLFVRLVPETAVVPAVVRGVLSPDALRHPIVRLRREARGRELLAATLQVVVRAYQLVTVRVVFGEPLRGEQFGARERDARAIAERIIAAAQATLASEPADWETLVASGPLERAGARVAAMAEAGPG